MNILNELEKIVSAYNGKYKALTISQLMDAKSKMVTLLCNFADEVAESKKDSLLTTVYRKYEHHKMKSQLIDEGFTAALAESKSIEQAKKIMDEETITEHISYLHKIKLAQFNKVVEDITQRISILRDDQNYHKSINN